jgi:hypothetical protein
MELSELRMHLEKAFSPDTAFPGTVGSVPSAGHCGVVAAVVHEVLGGALISTHLHGISHWFNRVAVDESQVDVDLSGDQFGYPAIQVRPAGDLYPEARERSSDELNRETLARAARFAFRAGLEEAGRVLLEKAAGEGTAA